MGLISTFWVWVCTWGYANICNFQSRHIFYIAQREDPKSRPASWTHGMHLMCDMKVCFISCPKYVFEGHSKCLKTY